MPDVTPKPLRSKGNALINLMGAIGGGIYLIAAMVLYPGNSNVKTHVDYIAAFVIVALIMLISLAIVMFFVNEPKLCAIQAEYERKHPEENLTVKDDNNTEKMPREVKKSLVFLLLSVAFWYIGYNGVTSWFTVYAQKMWGMGDSKASLCLMVAIVGAMLSYIPVGILTGRVGRKKIIKIGVLTLCGCFVTAFAYTLLFDNFHWILVALLAVIGVAWAAINVNSFPMVVEMCAGDDVGRFTGLYYSFSMAAQAITPIISGFLLKGISYKSLFAYAALAVFISFVTMCFVKHGDSKTVVKKGLEVFDVDD